MQEMTAHGNEHHQTPLTIQRIRMIQTRGLGQILIAQVSLYIALHCLPCTGKEKR